jgi:tetratricopeptide (TPR) repeat protein
MKFMQNLASIKPCLALCVTMALAVVTASAKEHAPVTAKVIVHTGIASCRVEIDGALLGTTDSTGTLAKDDVEPGDHYLHILCPQKPDAGFFISPQAGAEAPIDATKTPATHNADEDPTTIAENKARLEELVQKAVQYRNRSEIDEAVAALRQAMEMDPENADLHREMGITFLLAKEWNRARVEMIEAIRHDRTDADAHNGLGYALEKLGNLDAAVKEYHLATQLEPDDASYRTHYYDALVKIQARKEKEK